MRPGVLAIRLSIMCLTFLTHALCCGWTGFAAAASDNSLTPKVEDALVDSVWYDTDTGEVVPVGVTPISDDSLNRNSRWLPKPKRIRTRSNPAAGGGAGGIFGSGLSFANLIGWLLLFAVVAGTAAAILYGFSRAEVRFAEISSRKSTLKDGLPDEQTIERMKHLPPELRRTDVNLRQEAERLMTAGQYDQAIILLYGHQLLLLDRAGMLRLNRGKTNRRYVRESHSADSAAGDLLRQSVQAFERSYFGRHIIKSEEFAALWESNGQLEQVVLAHQEVAA